MVSFPGGGLQHLHRRFFGNDFIGDIKFGSIFLTVLFTMISPGSVFSLVGDPN